MTNKQPERSVEEMTVGELNLDYATKDVWEVLPFTKSFIERNTKTKDDADCILRKVSEHHKEIVEIFTQTLQAERQRCEEMVEELVNKLIDILSSVDGESRSELNENIVFEMRKALTQPTPLTNDKTK